MWPAIFAGYRGIVDSTGRAQAAIRIPSLQALVGLRIYTALVTIDPKAPAGVREISQSKAFTITK